MYPKKSIKLTLTICLLLLLVLFTSCAAGKEPEPPKENNSDKISTKIDAYTTDLLDSSDSMQSNQAILKYLSGWAEAKKIDHYLDKAGNLIFTRGASEGYGQCAPTVLLCPCDYRQYQQCIPPIAMSLYLIKNTEDAGRLTVIYTPSEGDRYKALSSLDQNLLPDNAGILTLNPGPKGVFATSSAAGSTYRFQLKGKRADPQLTAAYQIQITGLPTYFPDARVDQAVNPISELENILTWINNRKDSFELASFHSGIDQSLYAPSASMTITIDANDEAAFLEKMGDLQEKWTEKYSKDYPDSALTYQKTDLPKKVYNADTTHRLVSFMYTLLNGEYYRDDEGNLLSICSITGISTEKKTIRITSSAYSLDETVLKEIDNGEMTLANLSGAGFETIHALPLWNGVEDSDFTKAIKKSYDKISGKSLHYDRSVAPTCTGYVQSLTRSQDLLSITVSDNIVKECTETILDYMSSLKEVE